MSVVEVIDPCMPGDKFDELLPFLVQLINPSTFSMLDNIMHQKVQGVHQTPRPKDVWMSIAQMILPAPLQFFALSVIT